MSAIWFSDAQTRFILAKRRLALTLSVLVLFAQGALYSQQAETTVSLDARKMQELLDRIDQLEASQKQLRERVAQLEKAQSGVLAVPAGSAAAAADSSAESSPKPESPKADPVATAQADQAGSTGEQDHMDVGRTALNIRGFGDIGFYGGNQKGQTSSFSLGQTNLFITSNLSERLRFLTEMVFEVHQNNGFQTDLERVLLEGSLSDYFKLSGGRYHTAIGYYNTAYHHSTWFQTATERPYIFQYEDEGGILPIHMVGVQASGQIPSGKLGLHYVAEVGNGRTSNPVAEPVQNYVDENGHKAFNVALFARPDAVPGLQTGFSVYRDVLSAPSSPRITETITDVYAVLARPRFEWLNEALMIRHTPVGGHDYITPAFYSQISQRFGSYRPYFRYQYVNASSNEPVFPQVGLRTGPSVGIRFDATESVALKLQYDYTFLGRTGIIDGKSCVQLAMCAPSAVAVQVDFKF
jgi:opacity protein-like surface antigen